MKFLLTLLLIFLFISASFSQNEELSGQEMYDLIKEGKATIIHGSTENGEKIYTVNVKPVVVFPERTFTTKKEEKKFNRLAYNVKKVYPYSQTIKSIFVESEFVLSTMKNDRERNKYIKLKEKELKKEFEDDIREMTYTQGRILIKLVDRETSHTTYELIEHFKGGISAMFWQSIARIFSTNLKYEFDADGDDKLIEEIVLKIENGTL